MIRALHCPKETGEQMNRKKARELAMQCFFQMEAQKEFNTGSTEAFLKEYTTGGQEDYLKSVVESFCNNREEIDQLLNKNSKGWPVDRMAKTDLAISRLAVTEILFCHDIPKAVAINEAVELAKVYGTEQSSKFINAILKNI